MATDDEGRLPRELFVRACETVGLQGLTPEAAGAQFDSLQLCRRTDEEEGASEEEEAGEGEGRAWGLSREEFGRWAAQWAFLEEHGTSDSDDSGEEGASSSDGAEAGEESDGAEAGVEAGATQTGAGQEAAPVLDCAGLELALPSEEAQQAAFVRVDVDGEGTLPFAGLCAAARGCWPQGAWGKPELVLAYNAARDGDGYVGRRGPGGAAAFPG